MKKPRWTHIYAAILFLFTVFIALDTFVISYSEKDGSQVDESMFDNQGENEEPKNPWVQPRDEGGDSDEIYYPIVTENSYQAENFSVTISELRKYETSIYVAEVKVSSARYLKTAFANDTFGRNVTALTSEIAEDHRAVFAVNGDYYGAREKGIVIRNGILYRTQADSLDLLCIYADGSFKIYHDGERDAEALVKEGVWQCMTFGPSLIEDGEITVTDGQEVKFSMQSNPRTAIG
ncbi:MAG: phosphodiester glycosidase family protein, partial [Oscillospiraceae bacterium]|nr:phosphodiester glycosidase family protein [Oscillospiraceae bacterium]